VRTNKSLALWTALGVVGLGACGGGFAESGSSGEGSGTVVTTGGNDVGGASTASAEGGASPTGGGGGAPSCMRMPTAPDATRVVVVSHPYDAQSNPSSLYEALALGSDGTLTRPGHTFTLGRSAEGQMAFTPDGKIGIVPDEDGDLGVVSFDDAMMPTVVQAKFHGPFYATTVAVEAGGDTALVLDYDTRDNGGGVYRVRIGCDGTLSDEGLVAAAQLPAAIGWLSDGITALLATNQILKSPAHADADLLRFSPPSLVGGADAFGDDNAIVSSLAVTHDQKFALIADDSQFGSVPPRVAVVGVGATGLSAVDVLEQADESITDPVGVATSPFDNAALVVSGFDNAIFALGYDRSSPTPFTPLGQITYVGAAPQLPLVTIEITRGALNGTVLVAENTGVRSVRFEMNGTITDLGLFSLGDGLDAVTGSMGVSP
jgi:hypothetical protein